MPITIVVKNKAEKYFVIRNKSQVTRGNVSRENRQEYDNEKRAREIHRKMPDSCADYNAVAISKMMGIPEHKAKKMIKKPSKGVMLDGRID